jgi:hypothetical protein
MSTKSTREPARAINRSASRSPAKRALWQAAKAPAIEPPATRTGTKQSQLIALLRSPAGGTMEPITELTGW